VSSRKRSFLGQCWEDLGGTEATSLDPRGAWIVTLAEPAFH